MARRRRGRTEVEVDAVDWRAAWDAVRADLTGSHGFLVVFALVLLALFLQQAASQIPGGQTIASVTTIGAVALAMARSDAPRSWYHAALVVGAVAAVGSGAQSVTSSGTTEDVVGVAGAATFAVFLAFTLPAVLGAGFGHSNVTVNTVAATLTAYLLIGMLFAALYRCVALLETEPFFEGVDQPQLGELTYFSLVTLTTLGYGDLSPASGIGRGLATLEAVLGQVFLVTAVALTVSRLASRRIEVPMRTETRSSRRGRRVVGGTDDTDGRDGPDDAERGSAEGDAEPPA